MPIRGIAFDCDGVLVDTEPTQFRGWAHVLRPFGFELTKEEYIRACMGFTTDYIADYLVERFQLKIDSYRLATEKERVVFEWFQHEPLIPLPHSKEIVQHFHEKKILLALVSSAPLEEVKIKAKRTGIIDLFDTIVSRSEVKNGKPDPEMYLLAATRLGINPTEMAALEDTPLGVEAAYRAGMRVIAVPNDFTRGKEFTHANKVAIGLENAQEIIDEWMDVIKDKD